MIKIKYLLDSEYCIKNTMGEYRYIMWSYKELPLLTL